MRHLTPKRREQARLAKGYHAAAMAHTAKVLAGHDTTEAAAALAAAAADLEAAKGFNDTVKCWCCETVVDMEGTEDAIILTVRQLDRRNNGTWTDHYYARDQHFRIVFCGPCGEALARHADNTLIEPPNLSE